MSIFDKKDVIERYLQRFKNKVLIFPEDYNEEKILKLTKKFYILAEEKRGEKSFDEFWLGNTNNKNISEIVDDIFSTWFYQTKTMKYAIENDRREPLPADIYLTCGRLYKELFFFQEYIRELVDHFTSPMIKSAMN